MAAVYDGAGLAAGDMVEFGPFRLDPARRLLTKDGTPVPLGDRAFEILLVLISHAPDIVSKTTLFEQAWPGVFTEDSTLRYQLWTLRKALDDGDGGNRYISTISGRGYCFVAPLSYAPLSHGSLSHATVQPGESGKAGESVPLTARRRQICRCG